MSNSPLNAADRTKDGSRSDEIREWIRQIDHWHERLQPLLPEIDPHDLRSMIRSILQPPSIERHWLLLKTEDGRYVP